MKFSFAFCTLSKLRGWRLGKMSRGTLVMTVGMGLRTLAQAAVFLIIARVLGISDYGAYSAILALTGVFASFSGLGAQALLVRDVSRNPDSFASAWGHMLSAIVFSAPFFLAGYLVLAWEILPPTIPFSIAVMIGLAELLFIPVALAAQSAYQGHEHISGATRLVLFPVLARLAGAVILLPLALVTPTDSRLSVWAALYALAGLFSAIYGLNIVSRDLGIACRPTWKVFSSKLRAGMPFAFCGAALKLYTDIDKAMLAKLTTLEVVGAYSAGYRVVDFSTVPISSLLTVITPRFFRTGESGLRNAFQYARQILPIPLAYSLFVGILLYLVAGLLPLVLGVTFASAVIALQWLAWLPLISLPRLFLQTSLIGGNHQNYTVIILGCGAALNIALNIWLIPSWGWRGAVIATYAAETFMTSAMLLTILKLSKILSQNLHEAQPIDTSTR